MLTCWKEVGRKADSRGSFGIIVDFNVCTQTIMLPKEEEGENKKRKK